MLRHPGDGHLCRVVALDIGFGGVSEVGQGPLTVTESLVDAKDEARQTESREALANALLRIEERFDSQTKRIVGVIVGMTGIMIAATAAMMGLTT